MKRVLFYFLLILQALVLIAFSVLYEKIDKYGQTISIKTSEDFNRYHQYEQGKNIYMEYEINRIKEDRFSDVNVNEMERNESVYVLLRGEDGMFSVIKASDKKLESMSSNEVVLKGKFQHKDSMSKEIYVHYGMEKITNRGYDHLTNGPWLITLKVAPWGQKKIVSIENMNE